MLAKEDVVNKDTNQHQVLVIFESHTIYVKLHLGIKLHPDAEL